MPRILFVDDEESIRSGVVRILERASYEVDVAEDGAVALQKMAEQHFDLVITDINMPEMDGIEVIMALQEGYSDVPVIAMSAGGKLPSELLLENADMLGAISTIAKPFEIPELLAAIESALAG